MGSLTESLVTTATQISCSLRVRLRHHGMRYQRLSDMSQGGVYGLTFPIGSAAPMEAQKMAVSPCRTGGLVAA